MRSYRLPSGGIARNPSYVAVGTVVLAGLAGLLVATPTPVALAGLIAVFGGLMGCLLPARYLVFLLGLTLPIWTVGALPPVAFDATRLGLVVTIALRMTPDITSAGRAVVRRWTWPLVLVGLATLLYAPIRADEAAAVTGLSMILSAVAAAIVVTRIGPPNRYLLAGLLAGASLSGIAIVSTVLGYTPVVGQGDVTARVAGYSASATRASAILALGAVIAVHMVVGRRLQPFLGYVMALLCIVALLLSGGRVGLAGLACALFVAILRGWMTGRVTALLGGGVALIAALIQRRVFAFSTLERLHAREEEFGNGRLELLAEASDSLFRSPIYGTGLGNLISTQGGLPHVAPITFLAAAGVIGFIGIMYVIVMMIRTIATDPGDAKRIYPLLLAVLFPTVILSPTGPFVSLELVVILVASGVAATRVVDHKQVGSLALSVRTLETPGTTRRPSARSARSQRGALR